MIYVTGDTHGDFRRFNNKNFPEQKEMSKEDCVIICGDFGGVWDYKGELGYEKYWLDWLNEKSFTTVFIDGNHECFPRLAEYDEMLWHGGRVHVIRPHVLHLMRGQIFEMERHSFFTFGGASSHDMQDGILEPDDARIRTWKNDMQRQFRINGVSWWKEELPDETEMNEGMKNLDNYKVGDRYHVDYIITHCPPTSILLQMGTGMYQADVLTDYFQGIKEQTDYRQWIFGHMHENKNLLQDKAVCIYEQIVRLL